tara:strand:+ start:785 stop:955 length:171 start_codon:yes stop_codon:yes gene_type:complete
MLLKGSLHDLANGGISYGDYGDGDGYGYGHYGDGHGYGSGRGSIENHKDAEYVAKG